jgi:flagellum-specific peptidoglycan hydrolase FlgJ
MNNTTNPSSIMASPNLSSLLQQVRSVLGPTKALTLDEKLAQLTEAELKHLLQTARFVQLGMSLPNNHSKSYADVALAMYPKMNVNRREMIAEMLQDADPVEAIGLTPKSGPDYESDVYNEWESLQPTPDDKSALALEAALADVFPEQAKEQEDKPNKIKPTGRYKDKAAFIAAITPAAEAAAARLNIDPKIIIAQSALETGWGKSVKGNSYFGIKAHGSDKTVEFDTHEEDAAGLMRKQRDSFRAYDNLEDSVSGYAEFISNNPRYKPMLEAKTTEEQISALGETGYATDSKYGDKIRSIVKGLET